MTSTIGRIADSERLQRQFVGVRSFTRQICEPLEVEDYIVQSMPDVSPTRWHLAHTTWFFETFVLQRFVPNYQPFNEAFSYLFNSYYNTVGRQYPRSKRGLLSRPTVSEVWAYRDHVDRLLTAFLDDQDEVDPEVARVIELGLHHEQQHQELMLTDIKHVLSCNPLFPSYHDVEVLSSESSEAPTWTSFDGGVHAIGADGSGFCFDNELPRHEVLNQDYQLLDRVVTNGEFLQFVRDQGYGRPEHWLSMGWAVVQEQGWNAPLNWHQRDGQWFEFTLSGLVSLDEHAPVTHVSYFEADAYARWAGCRLPTESEWESAASGCSLDGNFADSKRFHPLPAPRDINGLRQCLGDVWEWTSSPYTAYPGYTAPDGALGEYNGKFMCNQFVLRGGSCVTSKEHIRPTYRNFFPPEARWQFSGIRLAQ